MLALESLPLLQPFRDRFGLPEDPQEILASQLPQVGVRPAASRQFGEKRRISRDIFQTLYDIGDSVEVATNPYVIDARHLARVLALASDL